MWERWTLGWRTVQAQRKRQRSSPLASEQILAGQVLTLAAGSPWKSDLLAPLQQTN